MRFLRAALLGGLVLAGCGRKDDPPVAAAPAPSGHARMIALLKEIVGRTDDEHYWIGDRHVRELRKHLAALPKDAPVEERWTTLYRLGMREGFLGDFDAATARMSEAHALLPRLGANVPGPHLYDFFLSAGLVWLRRGEVENCVARHSSESCILPIRGKGVHVEQQSSRRAIGYFMELATRFPDRLAPRWFLNIAYMTVGGYPAEVPPGFLIPPRVFESEEAFPRFVNIASRAGVDTFNLAGSLLAEDLDDDGFLDLIVSSWDPRTPLRVFRNTGRGAFSDRSAEAGLQGILGGANLCQTDFNNDGNPDVLVLRGTWLGTAGRHPKSLLRNNGDGTFTDVTFEAGLGKVHYPTEAAGWADYDNDGDLDLYVGNECGDGVDAPSQLFRNNGDGTFTDVAGQAGVENRRFAKGVSWGDYDGDGAPDLYVTNLRKEGNRLYHNNRDGTFTDVAPMLGVTRPLVAYSVWFWDFDNDGNLDLYVSSYQGGIEAVAAGYLGVPLPPGTPLPPGASLHPGASPPPGVELACLYRGDGHGGFMEVAKACNLKRPAMTMGANFGDLDNDGWLDFYLGTGYPEYDALMPKVMYRNRKGFLFTDVTFAGGFGHVQKGHGVAFADFDNDGDQDVFEQMGGAFRGDGASNVLYENPGFGNHWIKLKLVGVKSNRAAIGARIRIEIDDGAPRRIHRHVSSGGSFGANPLRQEIGLGRATVIDVLEITWPTSGLKQTFRKVAVDQLLEITEGREPFKVIDLRPK